MSLAWALLLVPAAYLLASINWAVLITRWRRGVDIRTLGTGNPGAANVSRQLGKGWGVLVYFLDLAKALLPLAAGRFWLFPGGTAWEQAALFLTGLAAIAGHCRPVFFRFRGGRGIAASMGVFLFFIPLEFVISVLLGFAAAMSIRRRVRFALGEWTPILFVTLTPLLTLAFNWSVRLPLAPGVSLGRHPWYTVAGTFVLSGFILALNWRFLRGKLDGSAAL